jgi:cytochrome c oxidase subunit III
MSQASIDCATQFDDPEQQRAAVTLGMWIFLTTEVLFFGGMFVAYTVYRIEYPDVFLVASQRLNLWAGGAMTAILLTGSLLVAMSDHSVEHDREATKCTEMRIAIFRRLSITAALGVVFLGLEVSEYASLIHEGLFPGASFDNSAFAELNFGGRSAQLFFVLFFCMTGLHAIHMLIGISLVLGLTTAVHRSSNPTQLRNPIKVIGLYWHFVDIVWIFLYPLFYLVR